MNRYWQKAEFAWKHDSIWNIVTPSQYALKHYYYLQEYGYFTAVEGYYTERAHLNSYLILYTISGSGILIYKNKKWLLNENMIFFIDCKEYQHYSCEGDHWEFKWIHFNGPELDGYYSQFSEYSNPVRALNNSSHFISLLESIIQTQGYRINLAELESSKLILSLVVEILKESFIQENPQIPNYIIKIVEDIERDYDQVISLSLFAKKYAVSKYHLSREFKKYIGTTLNEYIINTRITIAKNMLAYSDKSIQEISILVGILNVSHFITLFKNRVELTPLKYRKQWTK